MDEVDDGVWHIYFNTVCIATLDERNYIIKERLAPRHRCCRTKVSPMYAGYTCDRPKFPPLSNRGRERKRPFAARVPRPAD